MHIEGHVFEAGHRCNNTGAIPSRAVAPLMLRDARCSEAAPPRKRNRAVAESGARIVSLRAPYRRQHIGTKTTGAWRFGTATMSSWRGPAPSRSRRDMALPVERVASRAPVDVHARGPSWDVHGRVPSTGEWDAVDRRLRDRGTRRPMTPRAAGAPRHSHSPTARRSPRARSAAWNGRSASYASGSVSSGPPGTPSGGPDLTRGLLPPVARLGGLRSREVPAGTPCTVDRGTTVMGCPASRSGPPKISRRRCAITSSRVRGSSPAGIGGGSVQRNWRSYGAWPRTINRPA